MNNRVLYRSEKDKMIGGVCGGLGEYFSIDPSILRVLFVIITIAGGSGILLYLILWVILPSKSYTNETIDQRAEKGANEIKDRAESFATEVENAFTSGNSRFLLGIILLIIGFAFLFNNFGIFSIFAIGNLFWPVILILFGILIIIKNR